MFLSDNQKKGVDILSQFLSEWIKRTSVDDFIKMKEELSK